MKADNAEMAGGWLVDCPLLLQNRASRLTRGTGSLLPAVPAPGSLSARAFSWLSRHPDGCDRLPLVRLYLRHLVLDLAGIHP